MCNENLKSVKNTQLFLESTDYQYKKRHYKYEKILTNIFINLRSSD